MRCSAWREQWLSKSAASAVSSHEKLTCAAGIVEAVALGQSGSLAALALLSPKSRQGRKLLCKEKSLPAALVADQHSGPPTKKALG